MIKQVLIIMLIIINTNYALARTTHPHHTNKKSHYKFKKAKHSKNYMQGVASFYGKDDGFNGKKMANGETFDSTRLVAAHPLLALGTKVKVSDFNSGKSVYVEITDRMPRTTGRIIDLSVAAAKIIGIYRSGITKVKLAQVSNQEYELINLQISQNISLALNNRIIKPIILSPVAILNDN